MYKTCRIWLWQRLYAVYYMVTVASCTTWQHGTGCYFKRTQPSQSKLSACVVVKKHLNVLFLLMRQKHLHQIYFMRKVITSLSTFLQNYLEMFR